MTDTEASDHAVAEENGLDSTSPAIDRLVRYVSEAIIGGLIGVLILWIAFATVDSVPFVYQGY